MTEDVTCEHGVAMDVHCCGCHSGFLFGIQACTCLTEGTMQEQTEVTTEKVAEWLVTQCANQDGWQIDVRIEVIPATDPCPMTDEDREALREQATLAIQGVHRALKLRSWYEALATPAPTDPHGAGPWSVDDGETPTEGA